MSQLIEGKERERYPLTPVQMGVYLECIRNLKSTMYNIPACYPFAKDSGIDIKRLISAIRTAVGNHAALKVTIDDTAGTPFMKPHENIPPEIAVRKTDDPEKAMRDFVKPFDLKNGPLCRFEILETADSFYLLSDFHHIVFDGMSIAVICHEISLAYDGEELPPEELTQLDLAACEEEMENSESYAGAKAYYEKIFSGLDVRSEIPGDHKEDITLESRPSEIFTLFTGEALSVDGVEAFTRGIGVKPSALFLGVFQYAVAKFSGQDETVIYTVTHGRHDARMQNTAGMLVRTLPLYARIDEESSITDFLVSVRRNWQNTVSHDAYPFVKLAADYDLSPGILIAYQSDLFNSLTIGGLKLKMRMLPTGNAISGLTVMVFKENGGYELRFDYRSDLYEEATIRSFADMYVKILGEFMRAEKLCDVGLLSGRQSEMLGSFNETAVPYDESKTVVSLFGEQVKKHPDNTAVVYLDKHYTYAQLDEITDRLAGCLHEKGIGCGDVVSVLIPRCEYMAIVSLGVLKSGAAYQPLDPSYPPERLCFMIEDAGAKLLVANENLLSLVSDYAGDILKTSGIPELPPCGKPAKEPKPQDLFVLLYTSGSTGTPKGAMIEHRNVSAFADYHIRAHSIDENARVAAYASYGFDACVMDIFPTLISGAQLHIIDEEIRLNLVEINRYFEENGITHVFMTTQVARQFVSEIENHSLKYMLTGGERLVPIEPPKNYIFENIYGPTECLVYITMHRVERLCDRVPIGKANSNIRLYVADKYGRLLPTGALGELLVSGNQVARGYLNRPEQKAFTKNPYTGGAGYERMYHTGDIVRYLPNGELDFVGRNDGQVKIRGFRIELSEVEGVIREYDGITDAAVIARNLPAGGQCVNAYIVAGRKIDIGELNDFIRAKKPPYMVPAATMQLDKIPLNVNGKVDKRKLPEIRPEARENDGRPVRTQLTEFEKMISDMAAEILGSSDFDIEDDLLSAGMTSLSIIRLAVDLNKTFGFTANVREMMKSCSVLSLENELQKFLMTGSAFAAAPSAGPEKKYKERYPLSQTQLGVYVDCMTHPYSTLYNIPVVLELSKTINAEKLAQSVQRVILAHPYVMTHFTMQNDGVEQFFVDCAQIEVPVLSMSVEKFSSFKKDYVQPHSLMKSPLFRIHVVQTPQGVYLLMDFHHLIFDGASVSLFLNQVKTVYEGGDVKAETYPYYDYVENEINARDSEEYRSAENFFDTMLKDFDTASEIPADLGGQAADGHLAERVAAVDMDAAERFCAQNGFTPAQLFLAATFYAVSRFTDSRNVYISTISNGRSDMRLAGDFGMFVKTLPLGIEISDVTALDFVRKSKEVFAGAIDHEIFPYIKICKKYGYTPNLVYEYQMGVLDSLTIGGSEADINYLEMNAAKFKTAVHIEERNKKPCVVVQYNDALYSAGLMQILANSVSCAAKNIIENAQGKIREISLLTEEENKRLDGFSISMRAEIKTKLLHRMFEEQAKKTPDAAAVVACDGTLTYRELDLLANRAANALIGRGIKHGSRVVILLSRTSKFFAALFGILKAGAAFIPSCPEYPEERIESIVTDSGADMIITEDGLIGAYERTVGIKELLAEKDDKTPDVRVLPEDPAYLIYTSGSTGKPKGVILRHIGIANYLTYSDANLQVKTVVDKGSRYGSVTTVSFDMSLKETMLSLCHGLTLVFADDEQTKDPAALAALLKENHVDVFNATPSRLLQYMELDSFAEAMAECKVILSGGEKYPERLLKLLRQKTDAVILNTYGPTEITVSSNAAELTAADDISVGRPLMNYIENIVDQDGNRLPIGVAGELLISGCGVADGYNKLPEQTEKAFITYRGERTYRSGDYAKWTDDGNVVILGRKDSQVKLRGLRIELGEIEKAMSQIEGIKDVVVLVKKVGNAEALCAYYTSEKELSDAALKASLAKKLTDYMVPSIYTWLTAMPLNINGKINIKELPEPVKPQKTGGVAAKTKTEEIFCNIFAKVLEADRVYADDNFFDLGGSSLTVTGVIIAANKQNIGISYGDVFANPTPKALAKLVDRPEAESREDSENLDDYDYTAIDKLLAKNNLEAFKNGEKQAIGDVLLTGATGFLGIHILYELLHAFDGKVYCLVRGKDGKSPEDHLNTLFFYYFEESLKENFTDRVVVLRGDITDRKSFDQFLPCKIDTVINCAANVKHFSKGTDIEDVNLYGALHVIDFCKRTGARLVHVSTMSVGGMFVGKPGEVTRLKENQLYFGQHEGSKYTLSKFLAERAVLEEAAKNLNAKIMRVGTLAPRNKDGEYQINFSTNTFMGRLKSTVLVGKYPYEMTEKQFEFSPIDCVARAILLLAQTPRECTVFHPFNNHTLLMGDLYSEMDRLGLHSCAVEEEEYRAALQEAEQDPEKVKVLSSIVAYQDMAHGQKTFVVGKSNAYTMQVLYRMGFDWPTTSLGYMRQFINVLKGLGFFD